MSASTVPDASPAAASPAPPPPAPPRPSALGRWLSRLAGAFWMALLLFALAGLVVIGQLPGWMIAVVVLLGIVLGGLCFLPRWLFKRGRPGYSPPRSFTAFALVGVMAAFGLVSLPVWYLAFWVQGGPTAVPLATLSNGTKTVVFQGMQHVASEEFYKAVVFDLEQALADGYTLFYEGVQPVPDRPDVTAWFNHTLRGSDDDLNDSYTRLAHACGLQFQLDYFRTLSADAALHPSRHVTADVSYLDMKTEYERLMAEDAGFAAATVARAQAAASAAAAAASAPAMPIDSGDAVARWLGVIERATPGQRRLVGIVCRGVLGMAISGRLGNDDPVGNRIILDFRNRALARTVAESPADRIYITYGAAHLPGFLAELRRLDPAFEIRAIRGVRPMTLPDEVQLAPSAVTGPAK